MDATSTTPLDQIADRRRSNLTGLAVQRLSLEGNELGWPNWALVTPTLTEEGVERGGAINRQAGR
jgi:hypothetical protein